MSVYTFCGFKNNLREKTTVQISPEDVKMVSCCSQDGDAFSDALPTGQGWDAGHEHSSLLSSKNRGGSIEDRPSLLHKALNQSLPSRPGCPGTINTGESLTGPRTEAGGKDTKQGRFCLYLLGR